MIYFVSDLDKTLIYSKNQGKQVVEYIGDKPRTTMTPKAYDYMLSVLQNENISFVPCTLRSYEQTSRVCFIDPEKLPFMICDNGASIYHYGVKDQVWDNLIHTEIPKDNVNYLENYAKLQLFGKIALENMQIKNINNDYIYIVCTSNTDATEVYKILNKSVEFNKYAVGMSGKKVYVIPKQINKAFALKYLIDTCFNDSVVLTSGDSFADLGFIPLGNYSIVPSHSDPDIIKISDSITEKNNAEAAEDILKYVVDLESIS